MRVCNLCFYRARTDTGTQSYVHILHHIRTYTRARWHVRTYVRTHKLIIYMAYQGMSADFYFGCQQTLLLTVCCTNCHMFESCRVKQPLLTLSCRLKCPEVARSATPRAPSHNPPKKRKKRKEVPKRNIRQSLGAIDPEHVGKSSHLYPPTLFSRRVETPSTTWSCAADRAPASAE